MVRISANPFPSAFTQIYTLNQQRRPALIVGPMILVHEAAFKKGGSGAGIAFDTANKAMSARTLIVADID